MLDFMTIASRYTKDGWEVSPKFIVKYSKDLMIRGRDFYAIWDEDQKMWSTNEDDAVRLIDIELNKYVAENRSKFEGATPKIKYMWDSDSGTIDKWHKYCQKQMRDNFEMLDEELIFSNTDLTRDKYASKKLDYPLEAGSIDAYDKLIGTLYSPEERHKLEWAIGAIVSGDSKHIQKFMVLYGAAGTGKSTILNIIEQLFKGYFAVFDAKALGMANSSFALEAFNTNPLVAIQHDGDLSKIEDNTRLNSLVSHEMMRVNEKFKATYPMRFKCFLFMGTNRPVRITDGKSGLLRRLIDVSPSGNKVPVREYKTLMKQITFELGAIAHHCLEVYKEDPGYYDAYIPKSMMGASNDFYNFVIDSYSVFKKENGTTLKAAWEMYKNYCDEAKIPFPFSKRTFKEELKNYFWDYDERIEGEDGTILRSYYGDFKTEIFEEDMSVSRRREPEPTPIEETSWLKFESGIPSVFDKDYSDCFAQYASDEGTPMRKWDNVKTKLSSLDTSRLHYAMVPLNHIVIDFDIKDDDGNKSFELNFKEASKWPPTYAELSKSGGGIHLHYIYTGDVTQLSKIYDDDIEVKVFNGNSSVRRKLTKCNNLPIATINSGLPLKEGGKTVINFDGILNEKGMRTLIKKHLNKEIMGATKPSIDMIKKILDEAYESGIGYDVRDMEDAIFAFAAGSSNQKSTCIKLVNQMKFKSEEANQTKNESTSDNIVFVDTEVFPNLFLVCYKMAGEGKPVVKLVNPKPSEIEELLKFKLVGFNNRNYDNHMLYGALMGYNNDQLYKLSSMLVSNNKDEQRKAKFGEAYNLSYTDVYDFAAKKQSLKKWEIELGLKHHELGLPWDEPVPLDMWDTVIEYCDDDVLATEAVFNHLSADWTARLILADLAEGVPNDTTNTLTGKIIFGNNRKPQSQFNYRNLAEPVYELDPEVEEFLKEIAPEMMSVRHGAAKSLLPYFPGYKFEMGISTYRGEEVGEGGCVRAIPGIYGNVALLDVASMHPHSALMEVIFGVEFTRAFYDIVYGRVHIKHEAWDKVNNMLNGKLTPYIQKVIAGEMASKDLANALKIAINSVYGLTAAKFPNVFRDPRNVDNIVAKRGALFMLDLKYEVEQRGFTVAHIKTDSIKIPDATMEIIDFVMAFGKKYGYTFEHEATYDRMCLVNDAVYIAKYADVATCEKLYGYVPGDNKKKGLQWTATGTQFQVPYVFKTLFSKEPIVFEDMCETKSVSKGALYLDKNEMLPDVSDLEKEFEKLENKYKKGQLSDITFESECSRLNDLIEAGHDYHFVGRVGQFTPIKPGCGGAVLYRKQDDKYYAATGTTGYRWLESSMVQDLGKEYAIDKSYYIKLVDDAHDAIAQYGDVEWFLSDDPYIPEPKDDFGKFMNVPIDADELVPFDVEEEPLPWD
jgi:hypothetical protein